MAFGQRGKAGIMATDGKAKRLVEYGIQVPNSKTILMVTDNLADAERMLDMIGQGRLVERTISYGPWRVVDSNLAAG